MDDVPSSYQH